MMTQAHTINVSAEKLDIREHGMPVEGQPQTSDRRLFMQLQVFGNCKDPQQLIPSLEASGLEGALYLDVNDPQGVALLCMTEDPSLLVGPLRTLLTQAPFVSLTLKPEFTMLGRTYATGRETDLKEWLLQKPRRNALNRDWPWAVWYPLRRKSEFSLLTPQEQGKILYEHAMIGKSYGQAGYVMDIRLSCYGLDRQDNEFVIGLVGHDLFPLSRIIQEMRKTQQTAQYMQSMGPFFIGKAYWQSAFQA